MQLKTFSAKNSAAVLAQIKAEFGSDAVILETREEDGRVFMTAALERGASPADGQENPAPAPKPAAPKKTGESRSGPADNASLRNTAKKAYRTAAKPGLSEDILPGPVPGLRWEEEWDSIRGHLLALIKPALRLDQLPPRQRLAIEYLQRQGVKDEAVLSLYERLRDNSSVNILEPLSDMVAIRPWGGENWPQRLQLITGPFGGGKTSVTMRMALNLRKFSPNCRICVVNADATRGSGRLLLRHYSDLSDLVYKEASSTLELVGALNTAKREGYDRILVDLPGFGRDARLRSLLEDAGLGHLTGEGPDDAAVHLALPPQYSSPELRAILERYACPHASSLVWTKLDEAMHYGQIVNVGAASGLPVSALSYGPGLGNSFVSVRETMLWRLLFKHELPAAG